MWPYLAILAVLGAVLLHWWWRGRFNRLQEQTRQTINQLERMQTLAAEQAFSRQRAVFDGMVEGLLLLDEQGRVQMANRQFIQFFNLGEELQGRTVLEATRSHELAELAESLSHTSEMINHTLRLPGPDERHLEVNAAPILDSDNRRQGAVMVLHDVTRIRKLEKTREEFVANVSHELRTPLSLIKGYAETLLDGAGDNPEVARKFLETIDRNAQRLQFLIEDLLAISSLESGRVQLNPESVSLREVVEGVVEDFQAAARTRGTSIELQVPDLMVYADADRLHQVVANLVDNAVKYGRREGSVTIRAKETEAGPVEVSVSDDGPGIPSEALGRVFERFYRVDRARSRDQGGTGLGLSIVKHIIQSHGGQVWVESELGQGATIFFTIPKAKAEGSESPA